MVVHAREEPGQGEFRSGMGEEITAGAANRIDERGDSWRSVGIGEEGGDPRPRREPAELCNSVAVDAYSTNLRSSRDKGEV